MNQVKKMKKKAKIKNQFNELQKKENKNQQIKKIKKNQIKNLIMNHMSNQLFLWRKLMTFIIIKPIKKFILIKILQQKKPQIQLMKELQMHILLMEMMSLTYLQKIKKKQIEKEINLQK